VARAFERFETVTSTSSPFVSVYVDTDVGEPSELVVKVYIEPVLPSIKSAKHEVKRHYVTSSRP